MKPKLLILIALLAGCEQPGLVPIDLSGTEWHWFEFNRGMNGEPSDHWIKFSTRGAEYRMERGGTSMMLKGQYERISDKIILTFPDRQDTLTIQKDKLVVKKVGDLFEFYVRVR